MKKIILTLFLFSLSLAGFAQVVTPQQKGCIEGNCESGVGKYIFANGEKFNGDWNLGKRNGYGRYDYKDGQWYLGDFVDDRIEGKGVWHTMDGKAIAGEWVDYKLVKVDKPEFEPHLNHKLPEMQFKQ